MVADENIHPVILCGGSGTRLWPASRKARPKPFLPLLGDRSLFRRTLDRCAPFAGPVVVGGEAHPPLIEEGLAGDTARIMVEPAARNTAPAIALAAHLLPADSIMLVCPSDHFIADEDAFAHAVRDAAGLARDGYLVSLGIAADRPETGYGYIKRGAALGPGFVVEQFVEKPDAERAAQFLADGGYSWNGGIFVFRAGRLLEELAAHRPEMAGAVESAMRGARVEGQCVHPVSDPFAAIEGESIDYAVMEPTTRAAMVPVAMGWSDIGSWSALHDARGYDADGNSFTGPVDAIGCRDTLVQSDGPRVSVVGLRGVVVVVDGDEVLVASRDGAQDVGKLPGANGQ